MSAVETRNEGSSDVAFRDKNNKEEVSRFIEMS